MGKKNSSIGNWINSTVKSVYPKTLVNAFSGKKTAGEALDDFVTDKPRMSAADRTKTRRLEAAREALLTKAKAQEALQKAKKDRVVAIKLAKLRLALTIRKRAQDVRKAEAAVRAAARKASRPSMKSRKGTRKSRKASRKARKGKKGSRSSR